MRKNEQMAWDSPYIQLIVLILAIIALIVGAAYFVPTNAIGQANLITDGIPNPVTGSNNIAGGAIMGSDSLITDGNPSPSSYNQADAGASVTDYQNQIECNDGIDNDKNGLVDLDDSKCKTRWDVSEKY